jgi:glycosyltransferase involved in cell wall biosynthesis
MASISKNENYPKKKETVLPVKMVFIGRIQPTKGIHLIIEAMHSFSPGQVQIDIYGRPETTDYYKQCISDSTGMPHVIWKGEINREEVVERLAQYDIFCLASTFSEMSPLVIQEAFAAQIPVLASKVYGNVEQIQDNYNGLLFEFNSSLSLKRKIQNLVEDTELLPHLKRNIIQPNNFESVSNAYLELYVATYKSSKCAK